MTVPYLGSLTVGACVPAAGAAISASLPTVQAQVTGLLAAQAGLTASPPTLATQLAAAQQIVVSLQALIAVGAPTVDFQLAAIASALADLQASLGSLTVSLGALGTGGVHAYGLAGTPPTLGNELQATLSGGLPGGSPSDVARGLMVLATAPASIAALAAIFAGVP